jgi:hypothetical protein
VIRITAREYHIVHFSVIATSLVTFDFLCESCEARCTGLRRPPISIVPIHLFSVTPFASHFKAVHSSIVSTTLVAFHADLKADHALPSFAISPAAPRSVGPGSICAYLRDFITALASAGSGMKNQGKDTPGSN